MASRGKLDDDMIDGLGKVSRKDGGFSALPLPLTELMPYFPVMLTLLFLWRRWRANLWLLRSIVSSVLSQSRNTG